MLVPVPVPVPVSFSFAYRSYLISSRRLLLLKRGSVFPWRFHLLMIQYLNEIVLHLNDIGLLSDPCSLPIQKITSKEKLADAIAVLYSKMTLVELRNVFLTAIQNIEHFILSKQKPKRNNYTSHNETQSNLPKQYETFNRLYQHHFEKLKILDHKKKINSVQPQCTFSPRINHDKLYRKVNSPFQDRNNEFMQKKKIIQAKNVIAKRGVPTQCTFKPKINNQRKQYKQNKKIDYDKQQLHPDEWLCIQDTVDQMREEDRKKVQFKSRQLKQRLNKLLQDSQLPLSFKIQQ